MSSASPSPVCVAVAICFVAEDPMWVRLSSAGRSPGEVCLLFAMVIIVTGVTHVVVDRTADPLAEHGNGRESPTEFNATRGLPYARGAPRGRALPQPLLQTHRLASASRRSEVIARQASSGPRAVKNRMRARFRTELPKLRVCMYPSYCSK